MTVQTTPQRPVTMKSTLLADDGAVRAVLRAASSRLVASDPGLARLSMAVTTVFTLATSLGVLYAVTSVSGQPFTVALLGVVISMIASMAFKDPQPRQRVITASSMLLIASATVTLGALLAPHKLAGDVVFVAIMAVATAARRLGQRETVLGMVAFMTYFFALFLGATVAMLPWLIIALAIGAAVSLAISFALTPQPDRQLRRSLHALRARLALLVSDLAESMAIDQPDERHRRRLRRRLMDLRETILMIDTQLISRDIDPHPSNGDSEQVETLTLQLFDLELAAEHLVAARARASSAASSESRLSNHRGRLLDALRMTASGLRQPATSEQLALAETLAHLVHTDNSAAPPDRLMGLALANLDAAIARIQEPAYTLQSRSVSKSGTAVDRDYTEDAALPPQKADTTEGLTSSTWTERLAPSTRQAVQVTVASSLAIVAGELLSPARWYWAVIAAFVIYSDTATRGQTLMKGRQRILGTIAGVAVGTLVASLVAGNVPVSIILIFVALFTAFYLMQVSYLFMVIGTTVMLALLYGLLGEFTIALLVTRIEETAIGAVIGILTAMLVLPTSTRTTVSEDTGRFLHELAELLAGYSTRLTAPSETALTTQVRDLDRYLATLRASAAPLSAGLLGLPRRSEITAQMDRLSALDHYARGLTRVAANSASGHLTQAIRRATSDVIANLVYLADGLNTTHVGCRPPAPRPAGAALDAAQTAIDNQFDSVRDRNQLTIAVKYLRQIDRTTQGLTHDLGMTADMSMT